MTAQAHSLLIVDCPSDILVDQLHAIDVVEPAEGSIPREVLIRFFEDGVGPRGTITKQHTNRDCLPHYEYAGFCCKIPPT